jgi:hypothetical protein
MTLVLKRIGPNRILPTLVFLWGIVTLAQDESVHLTRPARG